MPDDLTHATAASGTPSTPGASAEASLPAPAEPIDKTVPDDELTTRILRIIAETQRKDPALVTVDSTFEELGIDSMDGVNIVFALENEFNINVPDDEVRTIRSVRDIVWGVRRLISESGTSSGPAPAAA